MTDGTEEESMDDPSTDEPASMPRSAADLTLERADGPVGPSSVSRLPGQPSRAAGAPRPRLKLAEGERDEDDDLVARAREGDSAAFGELFNRHHGRVYAMCCRMLKEPAEVEDAVQHAFLEAWRCLDRFEGRSRFSTWITRIAIHTCLGLRRKVKRLVLTDEVPEPMPVGPQLSGAPPAPDEGASRVRRQRAVDEVLASLSPKKRAVFVLAELEGMTAPEIARIVEVPEATVRTRLFHARRDFAAKARAHPGFSDLFDGRDAIRGES